MAGTDLEGAEDIDGRVGSVQPWWRRSEFVVVLAVVAIFAVLFGWRMVRFMPPARPEMPPAPVAAVVLAPVSVPSTIDAVGSLRAVREVMLAPEVAGRVSEIGFSGGQSVSAGATLVRLFDGPERADLAAAVARENLSRLQLTRARTLAVGGAESTEVLQQRQAEYEQAGAAVRQISARLSQKQIAAPFAGQMGIRQVNLGQYLNPGDKVATLVALDELFVDFSVPQQQLAKLRPGSMVSVRSDAWPGKSFTAIVSAVEPRVDEQTRTLLVEARLANRGRLLRPGMFVKATLELEAIPDALVLPVSAIQTSVQGESVVAVRGARAKSEGVAEFVPVKTGLRFGDSVVVLSGVKAGDVVVTEGQMRIQPGAKVQVTRLVAAPQAR